MTLLKYFNHIKLSKERIQSVLPKPDGPLARLIPCSAIESANIAVVGLHEFLPMQGHCHLPIVRAAVTEFLADMKMTNIKHDTMMGDSML